jgi:hypothetical protein
MRIDLCEWYLFIILPRQFELVIEEVKHLLQLAVAVRDEPEEVLGRAVSNGRP